MTLVNLKKSILLLELEHFKIISKREKEIPFLSDYHLERLGSIVHSVNYKANILGLSLEQIAAEYFVRVCCGHKLVDGNKRMAVASLGYFLAINNRISSISPIRLRNFAIELAHQDTSNIPVEIKVEYFISKISGTV